MRAKQNRSLEAGSGMLRLVICCALGIVATSRSAQSEKPLPIVASASVPLYPRVAQTAHISGVVKLRISTDGIQASSIDLESGSPLLGRAAEENIKTWKFEKHSPTTFEAT